MKRKFLPKKMLLDNGSVEIKQLEDDKFELKFYEFDKYVDTNILDYKQVCEKLTQLNAYIPLGF
jgi:hypothetical protein